MRRPLQPLQPLQKAQLQPPFGPSVDSLCHPCITTTHLSYSVLSLKLPPPSCAVLLVKHWISGYPVFRRTHMWVLPDTNIICLQDGSTNMYTYIYIHSYITSHYITLPLHYHYIYITFTLRLQYITFTSNYITFTFTFNYITYIHVYIYMKQFGSQACPLHKGYWLYSSNHSNHSNRHHPRVGCRKRPWFAA